MLMEVTINYTMITVMALVPLPHSLAKEISDLNMTGTGQMTDKHIKGQLLLVNIM